MKSSPSPEQAATPGQRIGTAVGIFVITFVVSMFILGIFGASNIVWGEDNQYGRIDIPGSKIVTLPASEILGSIAVALPGRGNETPDLRLPNDLSLDITPMNGGQKPTVTQDIGDSSNALDTLDDTQRRVWRITVPIAGDYRVDIKGDFNNLGVNPQLWLGHGAPLPGAAVPIIATIVSAVVTLAWFAWQRKKVTPNLI